MGEYNEAAFERWAKQDAEWQEIARAMVAAAGGGPVTPHQITTEQRKRMLARGERPFELAELRAEVESGEIIVLTIDPTRIEGT